MDILIIIGSEAHYYRLLSGFQGCGCNVLLANDADSIPNSKFDYIFIDSSINYSIKNKTLNGLLIAFDCEDDPKHLNSGLGYLELQDKIKYYAKLVYIENDKKFSKHKLIAFPIQNYLMYTQVAAAELPELSYKNAIPCFVGAPTFIGNMPEAERYAKVIKDVNFAAYSPTNTVMYNQRIQWLDSLQQDLVYYVGGLVFKNEPNHSLEWQTKHFGNVSKFETRPIDANQHLNMLANCKIGLCPTGYDRISFRTFDLMAMGNIIYFTDIGERKMLYLPKVAYTVSDFYDLSTILNQSRDDWKWLYQESKQNREIMRTNTPNKILNDFKEQLSG